MLNTTAGKIGDNPSTLIGQTVEFPDFHGRTVTGVLQKAECPATAAYALLRVEGINRDITVFRNTPVKVLG